MSANRSPLLSEILNYCAARNTSLNEMPPGDVIRIFQAINSDDLDANTRKVVDIDYNDLLACIQHVKNKLPITRKNAGKILTPLLPSMANAVYRIHSALNDPQDSSWKDGISAEKLDVIISDLCKAYIFRITQLLCDEVIKTHKSGDKVDENLLNLTRLLSFIGKVTFDQLLQFARITRDECSDPLPTADSLIALLEAEAEANFTLKNALSKIFPLSTPKPSPSTTPRATTPRTTPRPTTPVSSPRHAMAKSTSTPVMTYQNTLPSMTMALNNGLRVAQPFSDAEKNQLLHALVSFINNLTTTVLPSPNRGDTLTHLSVLLTLIQTHPHDESLYQLLRPIYVTINAFLNEVALSIQQETLTLERQQDINFLNRVISSAVTKLQAFNNTLDDNKKIDIGSVIVQIAHTTNAIQTSAKFYELRSRANINTHVLRFSGFSQSQPDIVRTAPDAPAESVGSRSLPLPDDAPAGGLSPRG